MTDCILFSCGRLSISKHMTRLTPVHDSSARSENLQSLKSETMETLHIFDFKECMKMTSGKV